MLKILFFLLFLPFLCAAQNNAVASGATASGTTGSATYTVGQVFFVTNSSATGTASQGVQQPFEIFTLSATEIPQIQLTAVVYPNPTIQNVTLSIKDYDFTEMQFALIDLSGKIISQGNITHSETQIDMNQLASANYFLKITKNNQDLKTFKIIKNN